MTQTETSSQPKVGLLQDPLVTACFFLVSPIPLNRAHAFHIVFDNSSLKHGPAFFVLCGYLCSSQATTDTPGSGTGLFQHIFPDCTIVQQLSGCIIWSLLFFLLFNIFPYSARATTY
jgi:hypothetical protein